MVEEKKMEIKREEPKELTVFEKIWQLGYPQYREATQIEITTIDSPKDLERGTVGFKNAIGDKSRYVAIQLPAERWLEISEWAQRKFGNKKV